MTRTVLRRLSLLTAACVTALAITVPARAEMVGSTPAAAESRAAIATGREALVEYLVAAGVPRDEAGRRVAVLPDSEVASLGDPAAQPAGGAVVGIAVFVFALLVLTDALGYTDIFPFKLKR